MTIAIRKARNEDAEIIVAIIKSMYDNPEIISPITSDYVYDYLKSTNDFLLVAEIEEKIVGLLAYSLRNDLWHAAKCCYIEALAVKKEYRGKGIGTELLKYVLECGKREKFAEVSLTVGKENQRAQELYKKIGLDEEDISLAKHL